MVYGCRFVSSDQQLIDVWSNPNSDLRRGPRPGSTRSGLLSLIQFNDDDSD
jgi:hypothetical protein